MKAKKGDKKEANEKSDFAFASCILYFTSLFVLVVFLLPQPTLADPDYGNRMLNFGGGSDVVDIGDVDALDGISQFTLEMWINVSSVDALGTFFAKKQNDSNRIHMQFRGNQGDLVFAVSNGSGYRGYWHTTDAPITIGDWFHLAAVFDGTQANEADRYTMLSMESKIRH